MAKRKKRQHGKRITSTKATRGIVAARRLYDDGELNGAKAKLIQLADQYPRNRDVLLMLIEVSMEQEDLNTLAHYSERLWPLERGDDQADTLNNLVYAYARLNYPALALEAAENIIHNHPNYHQIEPQKKMVASVTELLLEKAIPDIEGFDLQNLTRQQQLALFKQHDHLRWSAEAGRIDDSIVAANQLLETYPTFIPALNNLSLSMFIRGDISRALELCDRVIVQDPDNFHALANKGRFLLLSGNEDAAREIASVLASVETDVDERWLKQAELYSFLGDEEAVLDAFRKSEKHSSASPILLHLAAASYYRQGHERKAFKLWRDIVKQHPNFALAVDSLADQDVSRQEREIGWYWSLTYWFSADFKQAFMTLFNSAVHSNRERAIENAVNKLLANYPQIEDLAPQILSCGDGVARSFIISFAKEAETPKLIDALHQFALGKQGRQSTRIDAIQFINANYPERLPANGMVPLWINGKQSELMLMGFEITYDPEDTDLSDALVEKHSRAYEYLQEKKFDQAEVLIREVIAEAPDFPSSYNHLAMVHNQRGENEEAERLIRVMRERFPDYFFGRIAAAGLLTRDKKYDDAFDLLAPLMRLPKLHISEFRALARSYIQLALGRGQEDGAKSWLKMWENVEDDHPEFLYWKRRLEGSSFADNLRRLLAR